eukprot:7628103-Pyramimonas_sp.AAC.1
MSIETSGCELTMVERAPDGEVDRGPIAARIAKLLDHVGGQTFKPELLDHRRLRVMSTFREGTMEYVVRGPYVVHHWDISSLFDRQGQRRASYTEDRFDHCPQQMWRDSSELDYNMRNTIRSSD